MSGHVVGSPIRVMWRREECSLKNETQDRQKLVCDPSTNTFVLS